MDNVVLRGYLSHSIRGRKGNQCTQEEITYNCSKAAADGTSLMGFLQRAGLPVTLYIPGAQDTFIQKAYRAGRITEEGILQTDCDIIADCDFLLIYDWDNYMSGGMQYEANFAGTSEIPTYVIHELTQLEVWKLQQSLLGLLIEKVESPHIIKLEKL